MSSAVIIAIVVVVLLLIVLLAVLMPRMRAQKAEREAEAARLRQVEHHRGQADERHARAELAESQAVLAQSDAQKARAEAKVHEVRAAAHERGVDPDAVQADDGRDTTGATAVDHDHDDHDRVDPAADRDDRLATAGGDGAAHDPVARDPEQQAALDAERTREAR